jgi:hypothetical protein
MVMLVISLLGGLCETRAMPANAIKQGMNRNNSLTVRDRGMLVVFREADDCGAYKNNRTVSDPLRALGAGMKDC